MWLLPMLDLSAPVLQSPCLWISKSNRIVHLCPALARILPSDDGTTSYKYSR